MSRRLSIPLRNRCLLLCRFLSIVLLNLCFLSLVHANALWFSDATGLQRIDTDTNAVALNVPQQGVVALTLNQKDNSLWALLPDQLIKYDAQGATLLHIGLKALANNFNAAGSLALDPSDDSVWIAGGNNIFHLDANGQILAGFNSPAIVQDIALAQDQTLWVLGRNQLLHYSPQSGLLGSANLSGSMQQANFMAIDNTNNVIWLGGAKQLFQIPLGLPLQTTLSLATSEVIRALALVPDSGNLWVAGQSSLFSYTKNGVQAGQTSFAAQKLGNPQTLVFDAPSQSLWLGHEKGISRFSAAGQYLTTLPAAVKTTAISTSPSGIVPIVTLVAPANNALTNRPFTPIVLHYDATCFGQPCNYPPSVFAGYTPTVTLNGQSIGSAFQFDPNTGSAVYTPATRYAEGLNTIVAYVSDSAGRRSKPIMSQFTVDTIAPRLVSVAPADGSVFLSPNITLQGSLDDPTGSVLLFNVNGTPFTGTNPAGQNFSYALTLRPGNNTFRLTASDLAGNTNPSVLNYFYSTLSLAVNSPANGATVDDNLLTVTGTFSGDPNPVITVNGVVATVSGNNFTATVTLRPGSNVVTVIGQSPKGAQATQTLTVISSAPGISIASPANGTSIAADSVLVTGQVQAPANSGVTVNGVIALVDLNNNFFANNVPLLPGSNTVAATVTTPSGKSSSASVTVTSTGRAPVTITASSIQGLVPLTVAFSVQKSTANAIASYQFNPGGPGNSATNTDPNALFAFTYTQPGTYQASVTVTDSAGNVYAQAFAIQVQDPVQIDQMFRAIWSGMNDALLAGDKEKALSYLSIPTRSRYAPVFDTLLPYFPQIIASYSPLQRMGVSTGIAEYAINRTLDGVNRLFLVYFQQDTDGIWHIDTM